MDDGIIRQTIIDRMRRQGESLDTAAAALIRGFGVSKGEIDPVVEVLREQGRRNQILDTPPGVFKEDLANEARLSGWYTGPEQGDVVWPKLRAKLETGSMRDVVNDIDKASTKVVAHLADPHILDLKKRGMVVGYVQSGKTANYTAVMAKAADAGYRLFIVLSGLHNNLRRQTQARIDSDLIDDSWLPLTTKDGDFGAQTTRGSAILGGGVKALAVVKKNPHRLSSLRDWLNDIPLEIRKRTPILILDDEADQATPNSASGIQQRTRINQLVRQIWAATPTGSYVGYTATPFANVFMDPNDEEELYPADFILDLPRPPAYFGAERVFGREPLDDADEPDPGIDLVRTIPESDAQLLRPPSSKEARYGFNPDLSDSLIDAVRWYLVATAIRRARQQYKHSSMLVHTTHYTQPHFTMKDQLVSLLEDLYSEWENGRSESFWLTFEREAFRASNVASVPMPEWEAVELALGEVLESVRVVVDNGLSEDRLDYSGATPETVIAVGGGTLSRGLTLEGLIVSYFTRTSNTYDTLLQMGRWFGYRVGYEDLPRIWVQNSLADDFRFLALVEEEIRLDMRDMERQKKSPGELGIRVRAHPGRLAIVARNKMLHANVVKVSYSGERLQTFIFDELDGETSRGNQTAVASFIADCDGSPGFNRMRDSRGKDLPRWVRKNVNSVDVISLLENYTFHPDQSGMRSDHMIGWIRRAAMDKQWNVAVIGSNKKYVDETGQPLDLGSLDLGLPERVRAVNRAPLVNPSRGTANIKALLSHHDWFADLDRSEAERLPNDNPKAIRREQCDGKGLIVIYVVSKDSIPMGAATRVGADGKKGNSRRNMESAGHLVGLGVIFPQTDSTDHAPGGTYYSVRPDWEVEVSEDEDEVAEDTEPDAKTPEGNLGSD